MATVVVEYQPKERKDHTSHVIEGNLYMWGGDQEALPPVHDSEEKNKLISCIEVLDLSRGKWEQHPTVTGSPPVAIYGYSSVVIGKDIFYFGGYCSHSHDCYHNSLNKINVDTKSWSEISPTTTDNGPMKKSRCGMAAIKIYNTDHILVIGGEGPTNNNTPHQHNALYEKSFTYRVYTNEIHYYDLSNDKWISIKSTGQCPPPCCAFTITSVNDNMIVLFGGETPNGKTNDIFFGTCSPSIINWEKISPSSDKSVWPKERYSHATTLLDEHNLLVIGGTKCFSPISDCWIFDINRRIWKELTLPRSVTGRWGHSLSVLKVNSFITWVIVFGGFRSSCLSDTSVIELRCSDGWEWSVEGVMTHPLKNYEEKLLMLILSELLDQEQLQQALVSKTPSLEYNEKHQKVERELQHIQMEKQQMKEKLHEQERTLQEIEERQLTLQSKKDQFFYHTINQLQNERIQLQQEKDQQLNHYQQTNLQLQQEKDQLQQEKDQQLNHYQQTNLQLQQEKDQLQQDKDQQLHHYQQVNLQLQQEKDQLKQEKDQLQQEKDQQLHYRQANRQLRQKKNQLRQEKDQLQHEKYQLQQEKDQLQQEKDQLQQEKDQLQQEKDQEIHNYRQANHQFQQVMIQLQQGYDQLQQEKDQLQQEKDQLQQEKDQLQQEKDQEIHNYRQANHQFQQVMIQLQQGYDQLQQEMYQLQTDKNQLQQEMDKLQHEKDQLQQDNKQLQQEKDQLQQEKDQLRQEKDQLQQDKNQLQREMDQLQQDKNQLQQEKDQLQQEKDQLQHEKDQSKDQIFSQSEGSWMITRDEIHITQEVIGKGGWGEVRVANFRGLRVAAKCLHDLIISHYNISIFNREMDIASKVRHPNLLQFIGATREGTPPIILCELMPTSLNHQLQTNPLTRSQIIRISQDVSCALNYLHLYRPHPILHRDVSSSNVLLQPSVDGGWKAKLSDYGSANLAHKISSKSAGPGNPVYSAPEAQFPDKHSPAMDVYSFGVLLMEMVLCQSPSFTTSERERQANTISWRPTKRLVKDCMNHKSSKRPSIAVVLDHLKTL